MKSSDFNRCKTFWQTLRKEGWLIPLIVGGSGMEQDTEWLEKKKKEQEELDLGGIYENRIKKLRWQYNDGESRDQKNLELYNRCSSIWKLKVEKLGKWCRVGSGYGK